MNKVIGTAAAGRSPTIPNGLSAGQPTTIKAESLSNRPILRPTQAAWDAAGQEGGAIIDIQDLNDFVLDGLHVDGQFLSTNWNCLGTCCGGSNQLYKNFIFERSRSQCVQPEGLPNIEFRDGLVTNTTIYDPSTYEGFRGYHHAFYTGGPLPVLFNRMTIEGTNDGNGIQNRGPIIVRDSIIRHNYRALQLVEGATVFNTLFYGNFIGSDLGNGTSLFYSNVFINEGVGNASVDITPNQTIWVHNDYPGAFAEIKNNIIIDSPGGIYDGGNPIVVSNNLFYNNGTNFPNGTGNMTLSANIMGQNPLLAAPPTDVHLLPGSPAIDAGATLGGSYNVDAEGRLRVSPYDIGRYEGITAVGPAVALDWDQQPSPTVAGVAISPAMTVRVVDSGGNTVTSSAAAVTLSLAANPGGATLACGPATCTKRRQVALPPLTRSA